MGGTLPQFLQLPLYAAIRGALATVLTGDIGNNLRTARGLARRYAGFEPRRVQRAMDTIGVAFPNMPERERRAWAMQAYEHLFTLAVEAAYTPRLITPDTWSDHIRIGAMGNAVRLMNSGRPCVLITGHCGNWELLGHTMAMLGFPLHALYRPLDLKPLDEWVRKTRGKQGLMLLDKFGATRAMPELMKQGKLVSFIADQNAGDRGLFVPFFNRLASTYKSIGFLALQFDAPIICGQARRLVYERDAGSERDAAAARAGNVIGFDEYTPEPFRYRIDVIDIIMPEDWKSQPDPMFYLSARYRRALEEMVRRAPEQNLWLHRYWKSRPRHEHSGKPFPAAMREKLRALPWMTEDDLARIEDWSARDARELAERAPKPARV